MAATNLITPATAASNSADVPIAAGAAVNFGLKDGANGPIPWDEPVKITRKDDAGNYVDTGVWLTASNPSQVITGEGTYRAEKPVTRSTIGVFTG